MAPENKVLLDKTRDCGIMMCGTEKKFFTQDGKVFDMGTLEEVFLKAEPKKAEPKKAEPKSLTCKLCGEVRATPEIMKEHLQARHPEIFEKPQELKPNETTTVGDKCLTCGAPRNPLAEAGKWQYDCDCFKEAIADEESASVTDGNIEEKIEKLEDDVNADKNAMLTVGNVMHPGQAEKAKKSKKSKKKK